MDQIWVHLKAHLEKQGIPRVILTESLAGWASREDFQAVEALLKTEIYKWNYSEKHSTGESQYLNTCPIDAILAAKRNVKSSKLHIYIFLLPLPVSSFLHTPQSQMS